jgi:hypothetical protein
MQKKEETGRVFVRTKSRTRKNPRFEERAAIRMPGKNGSVLLRPVAAARPVPRGPCSPQGSHLFVGLGKHANVGRRFEMNLEHL